MNIGIKNSQILNHNETFLELKTCFLVTGCDLSMSIFQQPSCL